MEASEEAEQFAAEEEWDREEPHIWARMMRDQSFPYAAALAELERDEHENEEML